MFLHLYSFEPVEYEKKVEVIRVIKTITGVGLKEAKEIVDNVHLKPQRVMSINPSLNMPVEKVVHELLFHGIICTFEVQSISIYSLKELITEAARKALDGNKIGISAKLTACLCELESQPLTEESLITVFESVMKRQSNQTKVVNASDDENPIHVEM